MIKKFISCTLFALVVVAVSAAPITRQQALNRAQSSLAKQGINITVADMQAMPLKAQGTHATVAPAYYVFNSSNSFVIAAGDDRMPEVLGYCDNGIIDPSDMPDGLKDLLECYEMEMARLAGDNDGMPKPNGSISRAPIAPMVKSKWDQGAPFNNYCPFYDGTNRAMTGCVATAMAQVMYYHKWPTSISQTIPAYTTWIKGIYMPALSASGFPSMSAMKDYYFWNDNDASASATAVAKLMLYCGQSLEMNYNNSSGASAADIPAALNTYFRYAPTSRYVNRENYTAEEWASLIYTELAAKRPVVYRGSAYNGGGHCYVLDGMDANGLFHINWGWNGQSDGYFLLTNLNPSDHGAGSSVSNDGYIVGSAMVVGITPENKTIGFSDAPLYCSNFVNNNATYNRSSSSQPFSNVKVHCGMYRQYPSTADIDFGIGLYTTSGTLKQVVYSSWLKTQAGITNDWSFNIPSSVTMGTYYLKPICRLHNTGSWVPCSGANVDYWQATITSTVLTLKSVGNSDTPLYTVNHVNFNGKVETNRPVEMVVNLNNNGTNYYRQLYMFVDNKCTTVAQCAVEPRQTGNISMHISAATSGSHTLKLCYDEEGKNILWQSAVYFSAAPAATLTASSLTVKNATSGKINDNKFAFSVKVTNNGSSIYSDYIVARIYRRVGESNGSMVSQENKVVLLASRGSQTLSFEFSNLVQNEDYFVLLYYYNNGQLTSAGGSSFYTIMKAPTITGDVDGNGVVDINDLNIILNVILGTANKSTYPAANVNGDGVVDITDANEVINIILKG